MTRATEPRTPRTEAGRGLWKRLRDYDGDPLMRDILAIEAEAGAAPPIDHGPDDGCGDLIWAHMEADPSFNEEMRRGREDIAAGRLHRWEDIKGEGAAPPIDVERLADALTISVHYQKDAHPRQYRLTVARRIAAEYARLRASDTDHD